MFDPLRSPPPRRALAEDLPSPNIQKGFRGALRMGPRNSANRSHDAGWVSPDVFSPAMSRSSSMDSNDGAIFRLQLASPRPTGLRTQALPPVPAIEVPPDSHALHQPVADYLNRPLSVYSFNREKNHYPKKRPYKLSETIALKELFGVYQQRTIKGAAYHAYSTLNAQYFGARSLAFNVLYATDKITCSARTDEIDRRIDELLAVLSMMATGSPTIPSERHASDAAVGG